jgi:hypothetical protein
MACAASRHGSGREALAVPLLTSRVPPLALARSLAAAYYDRAEGAII